MERIGKFQRDEVSAFYAVLFVGTFAIVWESRDYFLPGRVHGFMMERIELSAENWWRYFLVAHVAGGLVCLCSSLLQYSKLLLKRAPGIHRYLGRIYALSIITLVFPTGVALAFVAKGGTNGTIGFLLLSFATLGFLLLGMVAIYKKNLRSHQKWISRSFALVTSAITFRTLQIAFSQFHLDPDRVYQIALWLSIAVNLTLCEYYLLKTERRTNRTQ